MVYPFVLGQRRASLPGDRDRTAMRLTGAQTVGEGLALLTYDVVRPG